MRSLRRGLHILLFAIPLLLIAGAAAAQTLTADINGDGVWDRIETRRAPGELIVRLSSREPAQHLEFSGSILGVVVTDVDRDGDSDLVLATAGKRHVRMFVWTNAGRGKFVSRGHKARDSLACDQLVHSHRRLTSPGPAFADGDLCSDAPGLLVLTSIGLRGRPMVSEPLDSPDEPLVARLRYDRPSPRGPPLALLFS
jgi:hypothetical protein